MNRLADQRERFPVLGDWMAGAVPDHLWGWDRPEALSQQNVWGGFDPVEAVLRALVEAKPARLEGKRRDFRAVRDADAMRGLQAELSFAARLVSRGVGFDFGAMGSPQPDLLLRNDAELGIEITARKADGVWELRYHLWKSLLGLRPRVGLHLEFSAYPYRVKPVVRDSLTHDVLRAIETGGDTVTRVVRPSYRTQPPVTVKVRINRHGWGPPTASFERSPLGRNLPLVKDTERAIEEAMRDRRKVRQAAAMPTVLVVDIGDVYGSKFRPPSAWVGRLGMLMRPEDRVVGLGLVFSGWWRPSSPMVVVRNPHSADRVAGDFRALIAQLGLSRGAHPAA